MLYRYAYPTTEHTDTGHVVQEACVSAKHMMAAARAKLSTANTKQMHTVSAALPEVAAPAQHWLIHFLKTFQMTHTKHTHG